MGSRSVGAFVLDKATRNQTTTDRILFGADMATSAWDARNALKASAAQAKTQAQALKAASGRPPSSSMITKLRSGLDDAVDIADNGRRTGPNRALAGLDLIEYTGDDVFRVLNARPQWDVDPDGFFDITAHGGMSDFGSLQAIAVGPERIRIVHKT